MTKDLEQERAFIRQHEAGGVPARLHIKVLIHGCGDFFSDHPADPIFREKKNALLAEARAIFASLTT